MKNKIFIAVLFIFIGLILGIGAGVLTDFFSAGKEKISPEQKIQPIEQPLAVATPLSDDADEELASDDAAFFDLDNDSEQSQRELENLIEQQRQKRTPPKVEPPAPAPKIDLSEYQVNPRKMETRELIPEQNAPRSGKITPDRVRQSELPSGGFEPPKRFTIPVESIDVRKVLR